MAAFLFERSCRALGLGDIRAVQRALTPPGGYGAVTITKGMSMNGLPRLAAELVNLKVAVIAAAYLP